MIFSVILPSSPSCRKSSHANGFTLIELSIVLVIIGLIVGGVLVGQDLVRAAAVRAQVSQIEKFNTAANTFREKYGYLPGDIKNPEATSFGFAFRGSLPGEGDGNGILMGSHYNAAADGRVSSAGETVMFWVDLSAAHFIDQTFKTASANNSSSCGYAATISACFPTAKIGTGNNVYVWSGGYSNNPWVTTGVNYFSIAAITDLGGTGVPLATPMLTVQQAYAIGVKTDDGLPQSGNVTATYLSASAYSNSYAWAAGGGVQGANGGGTQILAPTTSPTSGSATTCYDNANVAGTPQQYSVEISNGSNVNCALSFRFQ